MYTEVAFDTGVKADFKGNFDLDKLEQAILEAGSANVPYIVSTNTCNSAGGQPVSIANLKAVYEIAQRYDIPVIMDSARFAENAYFIQQRERDYRNWSIEEITREAYKYADGLAMSAKRMPCCKWADYSASKTKAFLTCTPNAEPCGASLHTVA